MDLTASMKVGLLEGLVGLQSLTALTATCDSGNCRFQATNGITHSSLGLSSYCVDTTSLISQSGVVSWSSVIAEPHNIHISDYTTWSNYSLSSQGLELGIDVASPGEWFPSMDTNFRQFYVDNTYSPILDNLNRSGRLGILNASIGCFNVMILTTNPCQDPASYTANYQPLPPVNTSLCPELNAPNITSLPGYLSLTAASCFIYTSVQSYIGSVVNGKLEEYAVGDPIPVKELPSYFEGRGTDIVRYVSVDPCVVDGVTYSGTNMTDIPGNFVEASQVGHKNMTGPQQCFYGLSRDWNSALYNAIGEAMAPSNLECGINRSNDTQMECGSSWWLESLYNQRNASLQSISQVMNQMTESLTNQMRLSGIDWDGKQAYASGLTYRTNVCSHFVWQWMLFPLAIFIGVALLLVAIVLDTVWGARSQHMPVWKSSILPALFYGLEEDSRHQILAEEKELVRVAKTKRARFCDSKAGWRMAEDR